MTDNVTWSTSIWCGNKVASTAHHYQQHSTQQPAALPPFCYHLLCYYLQIVCGHIRAINSPVHTPHFIAALPVCALQHHNPNPKPEPTNPPNIERCPTCVHEVDQCTFLLLLILLLLNWAKTTPDCPFMSCKSSSQTTLIAYTPRLIAYTPPLSRHLPWHPDTRSGSSSAAAL